MKRVIQFSRGYVPAAIGSTILILFGIVGYFIFGFNLGVDFQAGINQTVQLAYPALEVGYAGKGNATLTLTEARATVVFSGAEVENRTVDIEYKSMATLGAVAEALMALPDVNATLRDKPELASTLLVPTFQGDTRLGPTPTLLHRAPAGETERYASIDKVRAAVAGIGDASVQAVSPEGLQRFLVRLADTGSEAGFSKVAAERIDTALEQAFGDGRVVVMKTDYVGARYSENLTRQSAFLFVLTIVLILVYATFRFGFQYGFGAVLATVHDALVIVCFVVWTRMEFNTSTIAALLTILGYSINDTIVQFDRVREDRRLKPTDKFTDVLNGALTETLGRTIITTLCTMITVLAIFFFTSGSLKDFALALFVGMVSGTYSTIYIASAFVLWWEKIIEKRRAREQAIQAGLLIEAKASAKGARAERAEKSPTAEKTEKAGKTEKRKKK
jgi:preprotein translocase subunit SecF